MHINGADLKKRFWGRLHLYAGMKAAGHAGLTVIS